MWPQRQVKSLVHHFGVDRGVDCTSIAQPIKRERPALDEGTSVYTHNKLARRHLLPFIECSGDSFPVAFS